MDALDILMNKDLVIPYFQPIISADNQLVVAYEALARYQTPEGVEGLGWFFEDESIPDEYRLELEDYIKDLALTQFLETSQSFLLCLNYDGALLAKTNGEALLKQLEHFVSKGLDLSKIVIVIKEQAISEDVTSFRHLITYLQSLGIRVTIDNVGLSNSNLDQIALLKPNIVKVNLNFMEDDGFPHLYREVHQSLSMLSRKIGATLLFDGVSNFNQLNYAWRNGGRYYQGDYLASAKPTFVEKTVCKEKIQKEFHHFIIYERKKMEAQLTLTEKLSQQLKATMKKIKADDSYDDMIKMIAADCNEFTFRVYITDADGFQQSSNAEKDVNNKWGLHEEGRFKNWSWRPYFLENIVRMNYEKRGILSDLYTDIERDERIRTYSYPINDSLYVFLDIPYAYLFEQDGLL
ncbi:EAL domain-containing protein [Halalkalibacterium ligniniphilum]|uniref:EAL domain-containing protein n=1 Tax=Halalkalibacterium ligniniphilum TaxID=1134413 RepID=UPI0003461FF8|nr:EAL-associated domain-containing protein [Halalkalibacterium ligniniphilum]